MYPAGGGAKDPRQELGSARRRCVSQPENEAGVGDCGWGCAPAKLKFCATIADTPVVFHVRSEPLLLSEAGIQGLCVSLNTPVLNIEELPVGPARAAIVLFDSGYGMMGLGIGVRSIETRQVVVFSFRGTLDMQTTPVDAMERAASFAERMGFLFDEDVVQSSGSDGCARALRLWTDLSGAPELEEVEEPEEVAPPPPLSPAVRLDPDAEELVLDDVAEWAATGEAAPNPAAKPDPVLDSPELWLEDLSEVAPVRAEPAQAARVSHEPPPDPPRPSLSRFRPSLRREPELAEQVDPGETGDSGGAPTLGRVALVRRSSDGGDEPKTAGLLLRLLGGF